MVRTKIEKAEYLERAMRLAVNRLELAAPNVHSWLLDGKDANVKAALECLECALEVAGEMQSL